ncbi:MAG: LapA family protein [Francisellaceae bacterium]
MKIFWYVVAIIILIIVCVLSILNSQSVVFNYIIGSFSAPLIVPVLIAFIFGIIVGSVIIWCSSIRKRKRENKHTI